MKEAQGDRKIRYVPPWPRLSKVLTRDGSILFTTRIARLFAYGFLSVILVLYLAQAGLSETEIGLLLTLTLIGDTEVVSGDLKEGTEVIVEENSDKKGGSPSPSLRGFR